MASGPGEFASKPEVLSETCEEMTPKPCLIFLHIPKTGGRTLEWMVLNKEYPRERVFRVDNTLLEKERDRLACAEKGEIELLTGHIGYGWHQALDRPCRYITFLRDPVERVISLYSHLCRDPNHPLHETVRKMKLQDFVESGILARETENGQSKLLAGTVCGWAEEQTQPSPQQLLEAARRNLQTFVLAGITERFDESLLLLERTLGWSQHYYSRQNVGSNRPGREQLDDADLQKIVELNQIDLALYESAGDFLSQKVEEQGESFRTELLRFQRINRIYGFLEPVLRPFTKIFH